MAHLTDDPLVAGKRIAAALREVGELPEWWVEEIDGTEHVFVVDFGSLRKLWVASEVAGEVGNPCFPCWRDADLAGRLAPEDCRRRLGIERTYVLNPDTFDGPCGADT
jgi:hypothetical protein